MTITNSNSHDTPSSYRMVLIGIAILLLGIAVGISVAYWYSSLSIDAVQEGLRGETSLIWALLNNIGIILPALTTFIALWMSLTAIQMLRGNTEAVRWAGIFVFWIAVGSVILAVFLLFQQSAGNSIENVEQDWGRGIRAALIPLLLAIPTGIASSWMSRNSGHVGRNQTISSRESRMAWNLLIPTIAILIIVAARPLETTFITSLTDKRFGSADPVEFIGFDNYTRLLSLRVDTVSCRTGDDGACARTPNGGIQWKLIDQEALEEGFRPITHIRIGNDRALALSGTDEDFLTSIGNTLYFTVFSVLFELILGLFIAMVVNSNFKGRGLMRAVMLVPWAIPTVISARLWELMLRDNQSGIINKILLDLNLIDASQSWLTTSSLQLNSLIMVDVWKTTPFMALLLLAGLQLIPSDLYEAASVDGASRWRQFTSITLPLLRPVIGIALIFRTLDALRAFDVFNVLLGRQKLSMATYNYETLIQSQDGGYASAVSVIIFTLIAIFTFLYIRSVRVEAR